jgi:hypothetical protein
MTVDDNLRWNMSNLFDFLQEDFVIDIQRLVKGHL